MQNSAIKRKTEAVNIAAPSVGAKETDKGFFAETLTITAAFDTVSSLLTGRAGVNATLKIVVKIR